MKATLTPLTKSPSNEKESFWKHQVELQKASRLSKAEYCRLNKLNYHQLGYWVSRRNKKRSSSSLTSPISSASSASSTSSLVAVKLSTVAEPSDHSGVLGLLGTLHFSNGNNLSIQDPRALSMILERMR